MYKAKALIGEKAGEVIYAKNPNLTHDLCRLWKIYCPECTQFLYFSRSKNPEKQRSYFGHYDYQDKRCPERILTTSQISQQASLVESHEQDLETAESFVERVFYGINPEFFQGQNSEEIEDDSDLIISSVKWFQENLQHKCKIWINHYCRTTGFLDWENPGREVGYLMDWLYLLARREDILKNLIRYFISTYLSTGLEADTVQSKPETIDSNEKEGLIWFVALDQIIEHLSSVARDGLSGSIVNTVALKTFIELKIPPNEKKTTFRGKTSLGAMCIMRLSYISNSDPDQAHIPMNNYMDHLFFRKSLANRFLYVSQDELINENRWQAISAEKKFLFLYTDSDGDLSVKGFSEKRYSRKIAKGISAILFNKTDCSMLLFLREGFISKDIAAKAAQLALESTHGNLFPLEALEEFRVLSGDKPSRFWGF